MIIYCMTWQFLHADVSVVREHQWPELVCGIENKKTSRDPNTDVLPLYRVRQVRLTVFPESRAAQYGGVPWWIIVLSILFGLLLLALLAFLLWKVGLKDKGPGHSQPQLIKTHSTSTFLWLELKKPFIRFEFWTLWTFYGTTAGMPNSDYTHFLTICLSSVWSLWEKE